MPLLWKIKNAYKIHKMNIIIFYIYIDHTCAINYHQGPVLKENDFIFGSRGPWLSNNNNSK